MLIRSTQGDEVNTERVPAKWEDILHYVCFTCRKEERTPDMVAMTEDEELALLSSIPPDQIMRWTRKRTIIGIPFIVIDQLR